jgi:hypothetical protein
MVTIISQTAPEKLFLMKNLIARRIMYQPIESLITYYKYNITIISGMLSN